MSNELPQGIDGDLGEVAQAATTQAGADKIVAAVLTLAHWTGGDQAGAPACTRDDIIDTYRAMLRDVRGERDNG